MGSGELCGAFDRFCFDAYVVGLELDGSLRFGSYLGVRFGEYNEDIIVDFRLIDYSDEKCSIVASSCFFGGVDESE